MWYAALMEVPSWLIPQWPPVFQIKTWRFTVTAAAKQNLELSKDCAAIICSFSGNTFIKWSPKFLWPITSVFQTPKSACIHAQRFQQVTVSKYARRVPIPFDSDPSALSLPGSVLGSSMLNDATQTPLRVQSGFKQTKLRNCTAANGKCSVNKI